MILSQVSTTMFEILVSIRAALLPFNDLKAVSNSSVVKSESLTVSLKDIKYSVKVVETGRIFFTREKFTFITKDLNTFAIYSAEHNGIL